MREVLRDRNDVQDIKIIDGASFRDHDYQILTECSLRVMEQQVPIIIAIPVNWRSSLIDIYIKRNMEFPFIPHIDIKGKICLYELEGLLIDPNLYGIIEQSLNKAHGQDVVQKVAGCGSAFIPYGSTVSIKTAAMCVDTVKKIFEGRYSDNTIISAKGDDYHLKRAGLKVSTKYLNQKDCIVEYRGNLLANPDCEICGEKNGN